MKKKSSHKKEEILTDKKSLHKKERDLFRLLTFIKIQVHTDDHK